MYGLISLYLGYAIYLVIFFRSQKPTTFYKEVTIALGLKLIIITGLYFLFFSHNLTKIERKNNIEKLILTKN